MFSSDGFSPSVRYLLMLIALFAFLWLLRVLTGGPSDSAVSDLNLLPRRLLGPSLSPAAARAELVKLQQSAANKQTFASLQHSSGAFYDLVNHVVGTVEFTPHHQYQRQPYVANGYLGSRIPNVGHGFTFDTLVPGASLEDLSNGWPVFNPRYAGAFVAGFFDSQEKTNGSNFPWLLQYGGESIISAVPQWTSLVLSVDGHQLDPQQSLWPISNYHQNLSLCNGVVSTRYTYLDTLDVQYDVLAHRAEPHLGVVTLTVTNSGAESTAVNVSDILDFDSAQRCDLHSADIDNDGIYLLYKPVGVQDVYAATYSHLDVDAACPLEWTSSAGWKSTQPGPWSAPGSGSGSASHSVQFTLAPGETVRVTKYVGVVTSDIDTARYTLFDTVLERAREVALGRNYSETVESHNAAWASILNSSLDLVFPDDSLLTLASRASIFHLAANSRADAVGSTSAISVVGLSSDSYGGMVFWDTDLWIHGGMLPFTPEHARSVVNYRMFTRAQALDNIHSPLANKPFKGAAYPWTSGRYGNCTSTGPCFDYEYHINTAVSMAAWQVYLSGAADDAYLESVVYPLVYDAAEFLASYVDANATLGKFTTRNLTDPDEYANHVNNAAYTNAAISLTAKWAIAISQHLGHAVNQSVQDVVGNVYLPLSEDDPNIVLEYSGMSSDIEVKQADVVMLTFPLENELINLEQAQANLAYYSMKQLKRGPAMTFPIFSAVANTVLALGCAGASYLQKAVQPYLRGPFAQFSEQSFDSYDDNGGTHPAFPFMTAHGGLLQAVLHGILGFRYDFRVVDGKIERFLRVNPIYTPTLPQGVFFDGIRYMNQTLTLNLTLEGLVVSNNGPVENATEIDIVIVDNSGNYTIAAGEDVVIPLRHLDSLFPNSLTECGLSTFAGITEGAVGDVLDMMNDGDNSTYWQALNSSTAKILVDLKEPTKLTRGFINWGDRPALSLLVLVLNSEEYTLVLEVLANVDFGNGLYHDYDYASTGAPKKQADVFTQIYSGDIDALAVDHFEAEKVVVPQQHNTTSFNVSQEELRFVLVEFDGVHDDLNIGAKVYECVFF